MSRHALTLSALLCVLALTLLPVVSTTANTSHAGWPGINGMLLMNKLDQNRPLDARPGHDPFGNTDPQYRCDGLHQNASCVGLGRSCSRHPRRCRHGGVVASAARHNELLGGHGNDRIHAGPWGDVIWGDWQRSGNNSWQHDILSGQDGRDVIYSSHGHNVIRGGRGNDLIWAFYGRGRIDCGPGIDTLRLRRHTPFTYVRCERFIR